MSSISALILLTTPLIAATLKLTLSFFLLIAFSFFFLQVSETISWHPAQQQSPEIFQGRKFNKSSHDEEMFVSKEWLMTV